MTAHYDIARLSNALSRCFDTIRRVLSQEIPLWRLRQQPDQHILKKETHVGLQPAPVLDVEPAMTEDYDTTRLELDDMLKVAQVVAALSGFQIGDVVLTPGGEVGRVVKDGHMHIKGLISVRVDARVGSFPAHMLVLVTWPEDRE